MEKINCLYCKKNFDLFEALMAKENEDTTIIQCPHCDGGHETKGFLTDDDIYKYNLWRKDQ